MSKETGDVIWVTNIGRVMFQQWASPIINKKYFILSRYDGYLYFIDKETKKLELSINLSNHEEADKFYFGYQEHSDSDMNSKSELREGYSLLSKPILNGENTIICGSDEGYLYSISIE